MEEEKDEEEEEVVQVKKEKAEDEEVDEVRRRWMGRGHRRGDKKRGEEEVCGMEEVGIGGERGAEEERGGRSKEPAGEKTNQKRRMRTRKDPKCGSILVALKKERHW